MSALSRRQWMDRFVKFSIGVVALVYGGPLLAMLGLSAFRRQEASWLEVGPVDSFEPDRPQPVTLSYQQRDGWVIRKTQATVYVIAQQNGGIKVLSNVCTHASCAVQWANDKEAFYCPCHDAYFDLDGNVTQGPPPRPLPAYPNKVEDGTLYVQLQEA